MRRPNAKQKKKPKHARKLTSKSARRHIHKPQSRSAAPARPRIGELFEQLVAVQARLRAPGGCPWDREQTHQTLRTYLIEEAYEVLDAIEKGNASDLAEELGDLLLQILFHADLAREAGTFEISDVITGIHDKMIRRHPHVFGDVKVKSAGEVLKNWAQLKAKEKQSGSQSDVNWKAAPSALEGVPRNLPALLEAFQMSRRAAHIGFDWDNVEGILDKLQEEIREVHKALSASDSHAVEEELGDLLFSAVNLARFLKFDPEVALKYANLKFKRRFQGMEERAARSGKTLSQLSKEELEELWQIEKERVPQQAHSGSKL